MNNYKIIILLFIIFLGCKTEKKNINIAQNKNEIVNNLDSIKQIIPPFGYADVIKTVLIDKNDNGRFDTSIATFEKDLDDLKFKSSLKNNIAFFKEDYFDNLPLDKINTADFHLSSKYLLCNGIKLHFISHKKLGNRIYIASIINDMIVDMKWIYFSYQGEMGFTYYKLFNIDKNYAVSIRNYEFTDEPFKSNPIIKYKINSQGKFIRYYDKNGNVKTEQELGFVKSNKRQEKWVEIKENKSLYNDVNFQKDKENYTDYYTYMEANYKDGLPIGEVKFFKLIQDSNQNGQPIFLSRKKGKLIYTETYENGEIKDRKFVK